MAKKFEGSKADMRMDKTLSKKMNMSMKKFEGSKADERMDRKGQAKLNKKK